MVQDDGQCQAPEADDAENEEAIQQSVHDGPELGWGLVEGPGFLENVLHCVLLTGC